MKLWLKEKRLSSFLFHFVHSLFNNRQFFDIILYISKFRNENTNKMGGRSKKRTQFFSYIIIMWSDELKQPDKSIKYFLNKYVVSTLYYLCEWKINLTKKIFFVNGLSPNQPYHIFILLFFVCFSLKFYFTHQIIRVYSYFNISKFTL